MSRPRVFDAAVEEPDLLTADRRARAARDAGSDRRSAGRPSSNRGRRGRRTGGTDRTREVRESQEASPVATGAKGGNGSGGARKGGSNRSARNGGEASRTEVRRGRRGAGAAPKRGKHRGGASRLDAGGRPAGMMIDPRIAARRARVAAEAAPAPRRRRRLAGATIALVVLLSAGGLALLSPLAGVRSIEVGGAPRTGSEAVRAASGLQDRPPLLRIDEQRVAARIAALPWVRRARVERRWPRTVTVAVEERRPAALAQCGAAGTDWCLVDATGRVLAPTSADPKAGAGLPRIAGVPPAGAPGASVPDAARGPLAVAVALPDALRPLVRLVRAEGAEVALDLEAPGRQASPPVVRLGPPDRIPDKLTAAATVLARTSVNGVGVLDVRVPESPALTRLRR